jgi:predicted lipoprotein
MNVSRKTRMLAGTLLVLAVAGTTACVKEGTTYFGDGGGDDSLPAETGAEVRRRVLTSVADGVVLPGLNRFADATTDLSEAASQWASNPADPDALANVAAAYGVAMDEWQYLELLQVGPAGLMGVVAAGEGLRDEIYAWPLVNRCRIDQETLEPAHSSPELLGGEPVNVRGLGAMEYLIFHGGGENACAPNSAINTDGTWATVAPDELRARQATYAAVVADLLQAEAATLSGRWAVTGGNFREEFAGAGSSSQTYASVQEALNALSDAMFYLEKETKDMKLATPLGLIECSTATCPEALESALASRSGRNVSVNLRAFVDIYRGGPDASAGFGFDDLLDAAGQTELRADMDQLIEEAQQAVELVADDLEGALAENPDAVLTAHDRLKLMLDVFKTQFIGVLDLDLPQRAEGDND